MKQISDQLYNKLLYLGIIDETGVRGRNFGASDYNEGHICTPWAIFLDHPQLTFQDMDIIKRVLRQKDGDPRILEYQKIIHDAQERIRQLTVQEQANGQLKGLTYEERISALEEHVKREFAAECGIAEEFQQ